MNWAQKDGLRGHLAPLIAAVVKGSAFAVSAIVSQNGYARGYTSVLLLFICATLGVLGVIAGLVTLALSRFGTAFELIASGVILPGTFLLILWAVRICNGE